jgi:putative ABC transport system permease protein
MLFKETLLVALASVRANLFRSVLTTLGIIIGVGSVITMVALGEGARTAMEERIQAMGTNLLMVSPGASRAGGVARAEAQELTPDDARAVREACTVCVDAVPEMSRQMQVTYLDRNTQTTIVGTTPSYLGVRNFDLLVGRFFHEGELEGRRRVAVLGYGVAEPLGLRPNEAVGAQVRIRGVVFEVIGVLSEKGSLGWSNPDDQVLVPLDTAQFRLFGSNRLRSITVQVESPARIDRAMSEVEKALRRQHKLGPGKENDFSIRNQLDALETFQESQRIFRLLLLGIASVSLLVGGIGIMNIMMVSVTERTREIGVRKALGAKRKTILLQFLIEALVLCLIGGALGIGLGAAASYAMSNTLGWRLIITPWSVIVSFAFAALVGLFFGIYPAGKASRLDPIEALRYE